MMNNEWRIAFANLLFAIRKFLASQAHLLLVWAFALPAILPLIQPTITHSADGLLHLYRVLALKQALLQGVPFPRWLPDLAYGYGFPLFVFYAPLSYYITAFLNLLPGISTPSAFNISLALATMAAGTGTYLFIKELLGPKAALLAAVSYVYVPYQLYNTLFRGSLPAAWAMAIFPFVFWIFTRLNSQFNHPHQFLTPLLPISALIFGTALLMHNTMSLLFVPLLGLYLGITILLSGVLKRSSLQIIAAMFFGFGLAAFFLIPAIIEKEFAQVHRVITSPDFDFHFNFVSADQLLSLPPPANTGLLNPTMPLTLGVAQVMLATIGLVGGTYFLWKQRTAQNNSTPRTDSARAALLIIIFSLAAIVTAIFMMLPVSVTVWEQLPLIAFVQFPHRLLGPTALVLATLAGLAVYSLPHRPSFWFTVGGITLIFITSAPLLYPRYIDSLPAQPTTLDMMAYEHDSGAIGTTSFGEYLPIWVTQIPSHSPLEPMYQNNTTVKRLATDYLPPNVTVESASYAINSLDIVVDSPSPYQLVFHTFYFPGWHATVDSQPADTTPFSDRGLIAVSMPEGLRRLHLSFQETAVRKVANTISIIIFGMLMLGFWVTGQQSVAGRRQTTLPLQIKSEPRQQFTRSKLLILAGLAILLILTKIIYLDNFDSPIKHTFDGTQVKQANVFTQINFGNQIKLAGYDLENQTMQPGQAINFTAYWQALRPLDTNYSALAQLVDNKRHLYTGQDNLHPGTIPSSLWQPWNFVQDPHTITVPPGTPPGDYFLVTGLYDPASWVRLPVLEGGTPGWSDVAALPVTVEKPAKQPSLAQLGIVWPVEATFGNDLRLLGAAPERGQINPNDFLRVALFWEATLPPSQNYQIRLRLLNATGNVVLEQTNHPSHNRYPTLQWDAGERIRDNHALWISSDFSPGLYDLQVQVVDEINQPVGNWVQLGTMKNGE